MKKLLIVVDMQRINMKKLLIVVDMQRNFVDGSLGDHR